MKPVIGVTPLFDSQRQSQWMLPAYLELISEAGGLPVILPLECTGADIGRLIEKMDGFLFTGGDDIDPAFYGEKRLQCCGPLCPARDNLEQKLFAAVYQADKPALGVCRGLQFMNAALGGTLYQDLPSQYPSNIIHKQEKPYDRPVHQVEFPPGSLLRALLNEETLSVNSLHHQGVKELSGVLEATAQAEDGLIEGIAGKEKRYLRAVQWHPEYAFRTASAHLTIMEDFIEACR